MRRPTALSWTLGTKRRVYGAPAAFAYASAMGGDGLKRASEMAVLNANYFSARLQ